jgi:hypothetical protein
MKYFFTVAKVIYTLFGLLCAVSLVLAICRIDIISPYARYFVLTFMLVLQITLVAGIIHVVIKFSYSIKNEGKLKVVKRICLNFIVGVVMAIIVSLIKYKILFSPELLWVPIGFSLSSIVFSHKEK